MAQNILLQEHGNLRQELHNLKSCQITFFSLAITSTGLLLGLGSHFISERVPASLIFLSPLVIILPCWCIFFDKATTITRIVGYYRVLEQMIIGSTNPAPNYIGWESALAKVRDDPARGKAAILLSHTYWIISWFTFGTLAALCLTISCVTFYAGLQKYPILTQNIVSPSIVLAFVLSFIAFGYTSYLAYHLSLGKHSYNYHELRWREILRVDRP